MIKKQTCISIDSPREWKEALKGVKHAFAHTWENCNAMHKTTGWRTYLYAFEVGPTRIVCPFSERQFDGYTDIVTPYGFSGFVGTADYLDFAQYWKNFAQEKGYVCAYISVNPLLSNDKYYDLDRIFTYNSVYVLDLTLCEEELYKNLSENRRRQLKDRERLDGLNHDRAVLKDFILAQYQRFFSQKNASRTYSFSRQTMSLLMDLDNVILVGAGRSEQIEAVCVFAYTPYGGEYLFNVSMPGKQEHSVVLLWYGVMQLKSLGVPSLNLGGGITEDDGVARFKQRFGGKRSALKCVKEVYNPIIFAELCRRVNADPQESTGYFPPYTRVATSLSART